MKSVVIVTSGQPAGNPRMTKEAIFLSHNGFKVTVIYCPVSIWGDEFDKELIRINSSINWICVGAHPIKNLLQYFLVRMRRKFWNIFYLLFGNELNSALRSFCLYSQELENEILNHKADLYIGHNLGSINALVLAKKKYSAGVTVFDFEDFHRGEEGALSTHFNKAKDIEDLFLSHIDYFTSAAPLISETYNKIYNSVKPFCVLNVFNNLLNDHFVDSQHSTLKLFWFSQTVGRYRGLENVIVAMGGLKQCDIQLTLLGNCSFDNREYFCKLMEDNGLNENQLKFLTPCKESDILVESCNNHIGICSENPFIENRNVCLTNKLFAYLISRNAIVASNTKAQSLFLNENPLIGEVYDYEKINELSAILVRYYYNRDLLELHRRNSLSVANSKYNWGFESNKMLTFYNSVLKF